jgi:Zn-dependent membrane protease YugP
MLRRIAAWLLLAGFVLLIINILVIGYHRMLSAVVYAIIAVTFLFTARKE